MAVNSETTPNTRGTTTIDDNVVEKIVGIAAREVRGVHDLGGGAARAIGTLRSAINNTDRGQGVHVEVGEKEVAVDLILVADYPVKLQQVADQVRANVTEVNITITSIDIPQDDKDGDDAPRVK